MVDERQRQRQTPLAKIKNQRSNALDNYYGWNSSMGRDVRTDPSLPHKFQYLNSEGFGPGRTRIYNYDPRPRPGSIPREFLRQRQPGIEKFNMRPPRQGVMGMDIASNNFQPNQSGIMLAMNNNPTVDKIKNIYNKVDPYIPKKLDEETQGEFYGYEAPMGPGVLTFGTDRDFDNFYGGYKMTFDDGGIATLPTPEGMQKKERVPLTDEQKDFLYDYMIDFMIKQKQREQREMKGRIPPFNYEGLEV
jgi:hypothetical protein